MPLSDLVEALSTITYHFNIIPTKTLSFSMPYFSLFKACPSITIFMLSIVSVTLTLLYPLPTNFLLDQPCASSLAIQLTTKDALS